MDSQFTDLSADQVDLFRVFALSLVEDILFNPVKLAFKAFHQVKVLMHDLLQKVVEEPLQTGHFPLSGVFDLFDNLLGRVRVVNKDDALFIQRKGEFMVRSHKILSVRQGKGPRQGIIVHFRLRVVNSGRVQAQVDPHIEEFFFLFPLVRGQDGDKLALSRFHFGRTALYKGFLDQIVHGSSFIRLFDRLCAVL